MKSNYFTSKMLLIRTILMSKTSLLCRSNQTVIVQSQKFIKGVPHFYIKYTEIFHLKLIIVEHLATYQASLQIEFFIVSRGLV